MLSLSQRKHALYAYQTSLTAQAKVAAQAIVKTAGRAQFLPSCEECGWASSEMFYRGLFLCPACFQYVAFRSN
jgi:hypothetical protein